MQENYINPIYDAAKDVLQNMIQLDIKRGQFQICNSPFSGKKVNVSIGITGDLKGFIHYCLDDNITLEIFSRMSGMSVDRFDDLVSSAIGELSNIITGNSLTNLSEFGFNCDLTPPSITYGNNLKINTTQKQFIMIPIDSEIGNFEINICLQK